MPRNATLPGPPPDEQDDSLLGAPFQQTKASKTCSIALVVRRYWRYVWWKGSAAGPRPKIRGPKSGERVRAIGPEDEE
jgi:hypothetical protein